MEAAEILSDVLQRELSIYKSALGLAKRKREAIRAEEVNGLNAIVKEEQKLFEHISRIELEREAVIGRFASEHGLDASTLTIPQIAEEQTEEQAERLLRLRAELRAVLDELTEINGLNHDMLEMQLEYTGFMLQLMTQGEQISNNYSNDGRNTDVQTTNAGIIDHKI